MDIEKVKELVEMMKANDLNEVEIVDGSMRIMLKRGPDQAVPHMVAMPPVVAANGTQPPSAGPPSDTAPVEVEAAEAAGADNLVEIVCPIVGTFYATPSPNAEPFVEVGSEVEPETVVCIIEAMKVMNEIKSEVKGTVKDVLVTNGQSVEYGQPLFRVEPA